MKRVLFVCLGNICRSPAAEGVFYHQLTEDEKQGQFEVDSAGTGGWHVGEKADARMRHAAKNRGIELTSRARIFKASDFFKFDYIITMDDSNYQNCKAMMPAQDSRAGLFPFREFVKSKNIAGVPDPYYGGEDGFEHVLDLLEEGCKNLKSSILKGVI